MWSAQLLEIQWSCQSIYERVTVTVITLVNEQATYNTVYFVLLTMKLSSCDSVFAWVRLQRAEDVMVTKWVGFTKSKSDWSRLRSRFEACKDATL